MTNQISDWWKLVKRRNFEDEVNVRYTISNQERISQEIINFRRANKKARNRASEFSELGISGVQQVLRLFPLTGAWNIASRTIFMCFFNTAFMTCTFTALHSQCSSLMRCVCTNEHLGWGRPSQSFRVTNFLQEFHSFLFTVFAPAQIPHDALMDGLTVSITTIPPLRTIIVIIIPFHSVLFAPSVPSPQ